MRRALQCCNLTLSTFNAAAKLLLKYTNTKVIDFFVSKKMNRYAFLILAPLLLGACGTAPITVTKIKRVYVSVPVELTQGEKVELKKAKNNKQVIENFLKALNALKKCNAKLEAIKEFEGDTIR